MNDYEFLLVIPMRSLFIALLTLPMFAAAPSLRAQSTDMSPGGADSSPSTVSGLKLPAHLSKLPTGFYLQDLTVFSSALFTSVPRSQESAGSFGDGGSRFGPGISLDAGWTKTTPRTAFAIASSSSLTEYRGDERGHGWNEFLTASVKRKMSERLRSEVFTHFVLTDAQQFLFGQVPESGLAIDPTSVAIPAASNLLVVQRNLLVSSGAQVWYDCSPRTTLSLQGEVVRNEAMDLDDRTTHGGTFSSTSASATGALAHALSPRSDIGFTAAAVRTTAPMYTSIYASTAVSFSHALNANWFARLHAGLSVGSSSHGLSSSASNILWLVTPSDVNPIGGATLEYRRTIDSFVLSTDRGVTEVYGAGAAIVWSSNITWNIAPSRSRWSSFLRTGYDLSAPGIQEHIHGWRGDAGVNRALSRSFNVSGQYAFLSSLYRYPTAMQSMHSHGLRVALVWTPFRS